jgi:cysteine desulfurase
MKRDIYLDYAATTFLRKEAFKAMEPYMSEIYGNPSSLHDFGAKARQAIEDSRADIAQVFHVKPEEIFFTSGGTESDNWAISGIAFANRKKGNHIITSKIEHPAVTNSFKQLEKEGFKVTWLDVDKNGTVDTRQLKESLTEGTTLVSIMFANNEIGTIQPVAEIGEIVKKNSHAYFHTDAVQAAGAVDIDLGQLNAVDLMSFSAHKFYGPKGVGGLFIRKGTHVNAFQVGGAQEKGKRAGTENVPGIAGMAKALELAAAEMPIESARLSALRDRLIERVLGEIDHVRLNGHSTNRLPNNANFSFDFIEGESLLMRMNALGVAASTGSACSSASLEPSHVLLAIGLKHETAHGSYRITMGKNTTVEDIDYTVDSLKIVVGDLREMSPLYHTKGECYVQ